MMSRFPPTPPATERNSRSPSSCGESDNDDRSGMQDSPPPEEPPVYTLPPPTRPDNKVLPEDLKTPDRHVTRDPRLIRLTGVHPFNVEPPLSDLYDEGFLTSKDLHYVRNHGHVPEVEDSQMMDWEFTIEGMVEKPTTMNLAQLIQDYDQVTYPITLVCAGNRRKEQNMVRKTKGFSWGAAGLSTALWTGVVLGDLIKAARPRRGARYVCFEGADKLPNGYYGTSIKLNWAVDPNRGVLVAHKMNGETLHPDHGKPLRIVIPGQIGGRSVKWLKRIIVTAEPSDNWYHIYDNRVLPTEVSPEMSADLPETWKDERYAIYDLNTNSAIAYPAHHETLSLTDGRQSYKIKGYAYAGGGKRITRIEVTLDKGKTWTLANISYPEDEYRLAPEGDTLYGGRVDMWWRESCFCWCFFDMDIPISDLAQADDIMVRSMDDTMMVQPRDMYWSVLGMMNNPWFRVVIHREDGGHSLRFEHPTQPALMAGGWMERVKKAGGNLSNGYWGEKLSGEGDDGSGDQQPQQEPAKEICMVNKDVKREISIEELRAHEGEEEPWFVVNGEVYDGTDYLEGHPGGATSIINSAAQDVSEEFLAIHSENAKAMLPTYHIGTLSPTARAALAGEDEPELPSAPRPTFLQPKTWTKALLSAKTSISPDTKIFTFDLEHPDQLTGLPTGQHLMMRLRDPVTREAIIRAYTPLPPHFHHSPSSSPTVKTDPETESATIITPTNPFRLAKGKLDILIKIYRPTGDSKGGGGGKMTQSLDAIPVGHFVDFKGPIGKFEYLGGGICSLASGTRRRRVKRFVMICGGSGITPIFQVLSSVAAEADKRKGGEEEEEAKKRIPRCVVLDGNRQEGDILCKEEMDWLAGKGTTTGDDRDENEKKGPGWCRVVHTLSNPGEKWKGRKGRVDRALLEEEVGVVASNVAKRDHQRGQEEKEEGDLILVCGPEAMEKSVRGILSDMGWGDEDMVFF